MVNVCCLYSITWECGCTIIFHFNIKLKYPNLLHFIVLWFQALCRITKHNVGVFESVIEKVGFPNLLNTISSSSSSRIQQAYVTMLCETVSRGIHKQKYILQKVCLYFPSFISFKNTLYCSLSRIKICLLLLPIYIICMFVF